LEKLLRVAEVTEKDAIISVGDLITKGPDSRSVMEWAMATPNLRCVLGNHEENLLRRWNGGETPEPNSSAGQTFLQLGDSLDETMNFIKAWPPYIEEDGFLVVHAGLDPRKSTLGDQSLLDLTTIRIPEGMDVPWYEAYTGEQLVIFGHWSKPEPVIRRNVIGLDTGCVYGGRLTALILPEKRLVSVPAERSYIHGHSKV
jgi:diadenosine tetraphosphatase ApaH/serine/threonine PP2A family protein phosphatase